MAFMKGLAYVRENLPAEQHYIVDIGKTLPHPLSLCSLLEHERATISCEDKLELLQEDRTYSSWTLNQIIKAIYLGKGDNPLIGVIAPGIVHKIRPQEVLDASVIGEYIPQKGKYWVNPKRVPTGMTWGTCTPFPLESIVGPEKEISHLVIYNHPDVERMPVNISIGGTDKQAYLRSMHLSYNAIREILIKKFGEEIVHSHTPK